jgi:glycosyltransferase involved in cell wall biosynthesis
MRNFSVIIPAFNEARTIKGVIEVAKKCDYVDEIIVVDDGSSDETGTIATGAGARVITLSPNRGKAQAMDAGVKAAKNDYICFLDADLKNFSIEILNNIIAPVVDGRYDMFAVIFGRSIWGINWLTPHLPIISGNRALSKETWNLVPEKFKVKFQIEIALNYSAKRAGKKIGAISWPGFSHAIKEKKYGLWRGLYRRVKMIWDIIWIFARVPIEK